MAVMQIFVDRRVLQGKNQSGIVELILLIRLTRKGKDLYVLLENTLSPRRRKIGHTTGLEVKKLPVLTRTNSFAQFISIKKNVIL